MPSIFALLRLCCLLSVLLPAAPAAAQNRQAKPSAPRLTDYVNPFIGTGGHGHTFPGAAWPFGLVQLSPDTFNDGWDWCSGYHESDRSIMGFSHTHLSGTGASDLLDILVMPTTGPLQLVPGPRENPDAGYRSRFSHQREQAAPGYYSVFLDDPQVQAELTVTPRAGLHKYVFPQSDQAHLVLDLAHAIKWGNSDSLAVLSVTIENDSTISGLRRSTGWAEQQYVYFVARFSKPFAAFGTGRRGRPQPGARTASGNRVQAYADYKTRAGEAIYVKVGLSAVSVAGAKRNLQAEIPGWNFEQVKSQARHAWEKELAKMQVKTSNQADKAIFYTALYHALLAPYLYQDVDGQYRGLDRQVHQAQGFTNYTVFSLWDTFRAAHPLYTLVQGERINDMVQSMLAHYDQFKLLPVWPLHGNETYCMIGYHSVPVIVDAYQKGYRGFDAEKAFAAMRHSATVPDRGLAGYQQYGYVPTEAEGESVSKTLEYAYDDWCIAQMAGALGNKDDQQLFSKRAANYRNVFDPSVGFARGKSAAGQWVTPFDPKAVNPHGAQPSAGGADFTEGNSWQYTWFAPQDVQGLVGLLGGPAKFVAKLDALFAQTSEIVGNAPPDVSGLVGQYAHGNEPSHHVAYLYSYAGQPWKTQEKVSEIRASMYKNTPDGLSGNEDCGQMSAWYLFSALGFYPVNPADGTYVLGTPLFDEVAVQVSNPAGAAKTFTIKATNRSTVNKYIQSIKLNGQPYPNTYLRHADLVRGGTLECTMGAQPNKQFGAAPATWPPSMTAATDQ